MIFLLFCRKHCSSGFRPLTLSECSVYLNAGWEQLENITSRSWYCQVAAHSLNMLLLLLLTHLHCKKEQQQFLLQALKWKKIPG